MRWRPRGAITVIALVMALGTFAGFALAGGDVGLGDGPKPSEDQVGIPQPTPTVPSPEVNDRSAALSTVGSDAIRSAVDAVEREDVAALLGALQFVDVPCTPNDARGGPGPRCEALNAPEGTTVPMFQYRLLETSYRTREQMTKVLDGLLTGHAPSLGLIARQQDGSLVFSFTLKQATEADPRGIDFFVDPSAKAFTSYTERFSSSTALDDLRIDELSQSRTYSVLYISDAMRSWEREADAMRRNPQESGNPTATP